MIAHNEIPRQARDDASALFFIMKYNKHTFKNGLRLITAPMKDSKTATIIVAVGTGSKYETKNINGLSHFVEHMFFKGTKKRPNTQVISSDLDKVGGSFNAFTSKEITAYYAKVDKTHIDLAMDVISDIFMNSKIDAKEIEKEKGVIIEEINMYQDMPMRYVPELFEELLYGDQPAGWDTAGTKEVVASLKRQDFIKYMSEHYSASNTVVCVSGNISETAVKSKISKYFSKINTKKPEDKVQTQEMQCKPEALLHFKKTDQTHFCLGVRAFDMFHPLKYAQEILAIVLGGNMSSRLFTEVREKRGLAYYVRTEAEEYTDSGYLSTQSGVNNEKAEEAIITILKEYKKIKDKNITTAELKKAKDFIRGKMSLSLDSSDDIANFFVGQEVLKNKIKTAEEILKKFDEVTLTDVKKVAQEIFKPENLNLALIGPFKDKKKFEKLLKI